MSIKKNSCHQKEKKKKITYLVKKNKIKKDNHLLISYPTAKRKIDSLEYFLSSNGTNREIELNISSFFSIHFDDGLWFTSRGCPKALFSPVGIVS
jgi:hypothetical protein